MVIREYLSTKQHVSLRQKNIHKRTKRAMKEYIVEIKNKDGDGLVCWAFDTSTDAHIAILMLKEADRLDIDSAFFYEEPEFCHQDGT